MNASPPMNALDRPEQPHPDSTLLKSIALSGTSVDAIVFALIDSFERRLWPAGSRFPSIREFARQCGVSRYAVVQAVIRVS